MQTQFIGVSWALLNDMLSQVLKRLCESQGIIGQYDYKSPDKFSKVAVPFCYNVHGVQAIQSALIFKANHNLKVAIETFEL